MIKKTYELLYTQYNHRRMVTMKVDIMFVISTFDEKVIFFFVHLDRISEEIYCAGEKIRHENWKCINCCTKSE
jgi:hypothetical protein